MQKPKSSSNRVSVERWNVADPQKRHSDGRVIVTKVAVRNHLGQFHGATNFKGSLLRG